MAMTNDNVISQANHYNDNVVYYSINGLQY